MRISDIVKSKGSEVVTLPTECRVRDVVTRLNEKGIGAVVISSESNPVAGIVSERDIVRALGRSQEIMDRPVADIMTDDVVTAEPDESVHALARLMTDRRVRHVPVVSDGQLLAIVSIGDVVKSRIDELEFERDQLESYVSGP